MYTLHTSRTRLPVAQARKPGVHTSITRRSAASGIIIAAAIWKSGSDAAPIPGGKRSVSHVCHSRMVTKCHFNMPHQIQDMQ